MAQIVIDKPRYDSSTDPDLPVAREVLGYRGLRNGDDTPQVLVLDEPVQNQERDKHRLAPAGWGFEDDMLFVLERPERGSLRSSHLWTNRIVNCWQSSSHPPASK